MKHIYPATSCFALEQWVLDTGSSDFVFSKMFLPKGIVDAIIEREKKEEGKYHGAKSGCWRGWLPTGGCKWKCVSLPLPSFRGHPHSLVCGPFFHLENQQVCSSLNLLHFHVSLWDLSWGSCSAFKESRDWNGSTWTIWATLPSEGPYP